jgi:hypothetical protein
MRPFLRLLAMSFLLCATAPAAEAARMEVAASASGSWIFVRGELDLDDGARFQRLLGSTPSAAVVALESPGGRLKAGLDIGTAIRDRQLTTIVQDATVCASACAIAWLGGSKRLMGQTARVGFHAAYRNDNRRGSAESGMGNALLGAYLSRLGLSDKAVAYITVAAPNEMTWLTQQDAQALGIDVALYSTAATGGLTALSRGGAGGEVGRAQAGLEQMAQNFPFAFFAAASQRPEIALDYYDTAYGEEVAYDGALLRHAQMLDMQRTLAQRWPEQAYTPRPDSVRVKCAAMAGTCEIAGVIDWERSSWGRGARASGSSRFLFQVALEGDGLKIRAETRSVITSEASGPQ